MPLSKYILAVFPNPNALYDISPEFCITVRTLDKLTIKGIRATCNADPTAELDWDLYYADDFITKANATLIRAMDTTGGELDTTSGFSNSLISAGKSIYAAFSSQPEAAIKQISLQIEYSYEYVF